MLSFKIQFWAFWSTQDYVSYTQNAILLVAHFSWIFLLHSSFKLFWNFFLRKAPQNAQINSKLFQQFLLKTLHFKIIKQVKWVSKKWIQGKVQKVLFSRHLYTQFILGWNFFSCALFQLLFRASCCQKIWKEFHENFFIIENEKRNCKEFKTFFFIWCKK